MAFTEELRTRARTLLGDAAKDFDDAQLMQGALAYNEEANKLITELSATKDELTSRVTELSANVSEVVELSATEKRLIGENAKLRIEGIAAKQGWSTAYTNKVRDLFTADPVIALSAEGDEPLPSKFLDLLAEQPVKGIDASGKEKTGAQIIQLSRTASDDESGQDKNDANPLLETAAAMARK